MVIIENFIKGYFGFICMLYNLGRKALARGALAIGLALASYGCTATERELFFQEETCIFDGKIDGKQTRFEILAPCSGFEKLYARMTVSGENGTKTMYDTDGPGSLDFVVLNPTKGKSQSWGEGNISCQWQTGDSLTVKEEDKLDYLDRLSQLKKHLTPDQKETLLRWSR